MSKKLKNYPSENGVLEEISVHQVRYTRDFLAKLKTIASSQVGEERPYSTFESLLGLVWRTITKARGLDEDETTNVKISINDRMRLTPNKPNYFGNLILWAFPTSTTTKKDLHSAFF
ncbi:hypothetical protein Leryth_011339 [Lithospermum erythrorhizon]|nr:hypothetical protein Leryth_011339 [Lithospermum erythrorhizon]